MKRLLQSIFLLCLLAVQAIAQERTVTGTVTGSDDGMPLPGVSVRATGTTTATQTGANGRYTIVLPAGVTNLTFTYIGYTSKTLAVSGSTLNATLVADATQLGEVVVVGYGTQERKNLTGAVGSVTGAELADKPVQSFDQALAGRVTGVQVTNSNGVMGTAPRIRIRGTNTISSGADPLYVVDGLPLITGSQSSVTPTNPLGDINPNDIQSIDVLKDGSATAIYGSRAANGVVIITTKKGLSGTPRISYNSWFASSTAAKKFDLLSADEFITIANEKLTNAGGTAAAVASGIDTDWQDEVFNDGAFQQNQSLSLSGATDLTNYYFSLGYADYDGIVKSNTQNKYQFFAKVEQKALKNRVTFGLTTNVNYTRNFGLNAGTNSLSGNVGNAIRALPNVAPMNPDGSYNFSSDFARLGRGTNLREIDDNYTNISYVLLNNKYRNQTTNLIGGAFASVNIIPGLDVKTQISTNALFGEDYQYLNPVHGDGRGSGGYAFQQYIPSFRYTWTNTLNYNKTLGDHNLGFVGGAEYQKSRYRSFSASANSISNVFFGGENIITNSFPQSTFGLGGGVSENAFQSLFARANYAFKGKYLVSATYRYDKLSALAPGNQGTNLPGASLGWRISQEGFFKNAKALDFITDLKLRGSYAKVGNTDIGNYPFAGTFAAATYGSQSGIRFNQAGNTELQFETSKKTDVGLDAALFNNRLTLTADYFTNDVDNIILAVPQPPSLGVPGNSINQNVGSMRNRGWEFSIGTTNIQKTNLTWNTDFNISFVKNEVLTLANNNSDMTFTYNVNRVGESIGSLYGYRYQGVNPSNGNPLYMKANGQLIQGNIANQTYYLYDPANPGALLVTANATTLAASDRFILGNSNPTYFGGFNNTVTYKNFDFNVYLVFSGGNKIMNTTRQESLLNQKFLNGGTELLERWTPSNPNTSVPKLYYGRDAFLNTTTAASSRFIEDGSFIRGQNITLGYSLPNNLINNIHLNKVRVYAQLQNAFVITDYSGLDPELNFSNVTNSQAGVDYNTNPIPRTFTFGLNVGF